MKSAGLLLRAAARKIRELSSAFGQNREGAAAVEFALLLGPMMTLFLGSIEVTGGIGASRKATLISRTVADLVAQAKSISDADRDNIFAAANVVAAPCSTTPLKIVVSSINVDANKKVTVLWSEATANTTKRPVGEVVTTKVPAALLTASTTLIWAEVSYGYTPTIGYVISGTVNLKDQLFMRPRLVSSVTRCAPAATSC
jgi:Flp pilus assembly protein TadG